MQLSSLLNDLLHLNEWASVRSPNAELHVHVYQVAGDVHLRLLGTAKMVYSLWWIAYLEALNVQGVWLQILILIINLSIFLICLVASLSWNLIGFISWSLAIACHKHLNENIGQEQQENNFPCAQALSRWTSGTGWCFLIHLTVCLSLSPFGTCLNLGFLSRGVGFLFLRRLWWCSTHRLFYPNVNQFRNY